MRGIAQGLLCHPARAEELELKPLWVTVRVAEGLPKPGVWLRAGCKALPLWEGFCGWLCVLLAQDRSCSDTSSPQI